MWVLRKWAGGDGLTFGLLAVVIALLLALGLPPGALAQQTYPTNAAGVRVPGQVPLQCDASGTHCAPVTAANPVPISGTVTSGGTAQGASSTCVTGPMDQGVTTTAAPTYVNNTVNPLSLDTSGNLRTTTTLGAGSAVIGKVGIDQTTPGTTNLVALAANQSDNVAQINGVTPLMGNGVTGTGSQRVTIASDNTAFSVNLGTIGGAATETSLAKLTQTQGSTTSGQSGPLAQGAVTTAAPSYTTAQTSPLSLDTVGNLRVLWPVGSQVGAVGSVANGVSDSGNPVKIGGKGNSSPPSAVTAGQRVDAWYTLTGQAVTASESTQGSTTSGQLNGLVAGAVTTAAPSYTTAQTSPLSLTTGGSLRVDVISALPAGTALIGKTGIDQTTSGTTNLVAVVSGQNGVDGGSGSRTAKTVRIAEAGLEYETIAASQTNQVMGATGATGDYLSHCILQPTTTAAGTFIILDNATTIFTFTTGTLSDLRPITVPVGLTSVSGAWKITTGANETAVCVGDFL